MKRKISLILLVIALFLSLFSCGYITNKSYIVSTSNGLENVRPEMDWGTKTGYKKLFVGPKTVTFLDNEYYGKYQNSSDSIRFSSTIDYFETESKTSRVIFGVRSDNGKLAYISFKNPDFFTEQRNLEDLDNALDYATNLSKDIIGKIVSDPDAYEMIIENPYEMSYMDIFHIVFVKKYGGYISSDKISFEVTSRGTLCCVTIGDIGAYDSNLINRTDDKIIEENVEKKIEEIFRNKSNEYSVQNITVKEKELVKLPDGKTGVLSHVEVEMKSVNDTTDDHTFKGAIAIVTIIG